MAISDAIMEKDFCIRPTMGSDELPTGGRYPVDETSEGYAVVHILDQLLTKDPKQRITMEGLKVS